MREEARPRRASSVSRSTGRYGRAHDRAEDPEDREEDPEEEHPAVTVPQRHQAEREHENEVQDRPADSPHHAKTSDWVGSCSGGWQRPKRASSAEEGEASRASARANAAPDLDEQGDRAGDRKRKKEARQRVVLERLAAEVAEE